MILLQKISVQSSTNLEKPDVSIDDLMKTYAHALQREVNITDLVSNHLDRILAVVKKAKHQSFT